MSNSPSEINSTLLTLSNNLADAVEQASPAVVAVNGRQRMSSSGVHWRTGIVVTANHTIRREEEISVTLFDQRSLPAILIGRDSNTDLAVLKLQGLETADLASLPLAEIGDSELLKVGNMVLAIGRSGQNGVSASLGIVSAKGSILRNWMRGNEQFVRLDLTLYPGCSGGPLVDVSGRIVGINTSGPRHMALAIPTQTVNRVINTLLEKGHMVRGYLGIGMQPVLLPDSLKNKLNLTSNGGVIVVNVEPNAPADRAGVLLGDVILALDNQLVSDTGDVQARLGAESVGKIINVKIMRGGALLEKAIAPSQRPHRED